MDAREPAFEESEPYRDASSVGVEAAPPVGLTLDDLVTLVPQDARDILDLSCGNGELGALLKSRQSAKVTGVAQDQSLGASARSMIDEVLVGNVERIAVPFKASSFDVVVARDVFEKVVDPWALARQASVWLRQSGILIAAFSNSANLRFLLSGAQGRFRYGPGGVLALGRLRFFTKESFEAMLADAGFVAEKWAGVPDGLGLPVPDPAGGTRGVLKVGEIRVSGIDPSRFEEVTDAGYVVRAIRTGAPSAFGHAMAASAGSTKPTMPTSADATIVTAVHNGAENTIRLLQSLGANDQGATFDIVLVDNGSNDVTANLSSSEARSDAITIVRNPVDLGTARGRNQGAKEATSEFVIFVDNTVEIGPGCVRSLVAPMLEDTKIGVVGPLLIKPEGKVASSGMELSSDGRATHRYGGAGLDDPRVCEPAEVDALSGAVLAIRRGVFERLGGYSIRVNDEEANLDLCARALELGWKILYQPGARVVHHAWAE